MLRLRLPEMEGAAARWYARNRGSQTQMAGYRRQAERLTETLAAGSGILEVAPGPGYHAVELARLGHRVTGLDISRTMVQIAATHAREAGMTVDFRHGDASAMPFPDGSFDLVVCQAAFKNFLHPVEALNEMRRVLRPGGVAVIQDLDHNASGTAIAAEVDRMRLGSVNALITRFTLGWLRRRAKTADEFRRLAEASTFGGCEITTDGIGLEIRLHR
jgi:ubiquinone/menaquinone biosynthesis C-methylase UbiE